MPTRLPPGHHLLCGRSGRPLRLAEQLQRIILNAVQHTRSYSRRHRLWDICTCCLVLRPDQKLPLQLEGQTEGGMIGSFPYMNVLLGDHGRRRISKINLWRLYSIVSNAKCWLFSCPCYISTGRAGTDFALPLASTWKRDSDPLDWNALHLIFI